MVTVFMGYNTNQYPMNLYSTHGWMASSPIIKTQYHQAKQKS